MDINVSHLSTSSPSQPIEILVQIREDSITPSYHTNIMAFIDSGAMGNFIHPQLVKKLGIPTQPQENKLQLQTVTRNKFFTCESQVQVTLVTVHGHEENILLDV